MGAGNASRINGQKGGRPKGSENSSTKIRREMKQHWLNLTYKQADDIFVAHTALALGHFKEVRTPDGTLVRVYKQSPNSKALQWIMEQIWGKVGPSIELDDELAEPKEYKITEETRRALDQALIYALPEEEQKELSLGEPSPTSKTVSQ